MGYNEGQLTLPCIYQAFAGGEVDKTRRRSRRVTSSRYLDLPCAQGSNISTTPISLEAIFIGTYFGEIYFDVTYMVNSTPAGYVCILRTPLTSRCAQRHLSRWLLRYAPPQWLARLILISIFAGPCPLGSTFGVPQESCVLGQTTSLIRTARH